MELFEAFKILTGNGYLIENTNKGDFVKGEQGGEEFIGLSNDYTKDEAIYYFASAIIGNKAKNKDYIVDWWNYMCPKSVKKRFETVYNKFESFKNGNAINLYRGVVIPEDETPDLEKPGVCWSFTLQGGKNFLERIWDDMVQKHTSYGKKKIMFQGNTTLDNCDLPYSLWLAGRFERKEWEVRIKDETKVKILNWKEVE